MEIVHQTRGKEKRKLRKQAQKGKGGIKGKKRRRAVEATVRTDGREEGVGGLKKIVYVSQIRRGRRNDYMNIALVARGQNLVQTARGRRRKARGGQKKTSGGKK